MATTILPRPVESQPSWLSGIGLSVTLVLTAWFLLVVSLGAVGAFVGRPGTPPVGIAIGVGAPLLLFFAWLRLSHICPAGGPRRHGHRFHRPMDHPRPGAAA